MKKKEHRQRKRNKPSEEKDNPISGTKISKVSLHIL
jgi:hypothetical protein